MDEQPTRLKQSARAVQEALDAAEICTEVVQLPDSTRTAKNAANAIGCSVAQIAKSIVFRAVESNRTILVIASGTNRINEALLGSHLGEGIEKATADQVRTVTGYAIGGVPPCGHVAPLKIFLDQDLLDLKEMWAAAGTPNAVFRLTPEQLVKLTDGTITKVT